MFAKRHRPKQISLTCPYCGHSQEEPTLVQSSFCRQCGEHFRVRKGVAYGHASPIASGVVEVMDFRSGEGESKGEENSVEGFKSFPFFESAPETPPEETPLSAGEFFGFTDGIEKENEKDAEVSPLGRDAQDREALGQGSMAALIGAVRTVLVTPPDQMPPDYVPVDPKHPIDIQSQRLVRCYRCYHEQKVSLHAKSTQCERCNAYISLANYEIKKAGVVTLRTRGDIIVTRKGRLAKGSEIACHNLSLSGAADAVIDASGEVVFRHTGIARGGLYCRKLIIDKGCEVGAPDSVMTEEAEIYGRLIGDLVCSGKVKVARTGFVEGNVSAIELDLKEGGLITGATKLNPGTIMRAPARNGFSPAIIG